MVKYETSTLDLAFAALADPTRRAIVDRLAATRELSVSELGAPLDMSLPAVLKHVNVLSQAGLVVRRKAGRTVHCRLETRPMREAMGWLERYQRFWSERLDALADFVESPSCQSPLDRASPSSVASKPRASASGKRGRRGKR